MKDILLLGKTDVRHNWPVNLNVRDIDDYENEKDYSTYDSFLREKGSVFVSPDSVVFKGLKLDTETIVSQDYLQYYRLKHQIKKRFFSRRVSLPKGSVYLLVTDLWSGGHFHWICDVLPRLWLIRDKAPLFSLLLPDVPYVRKIGLESINILGLHFKDIVWMNADSFYRVPDLYFVSRVHRSGQVHPDLVGQIRQKMLNGKLSGTKRVYISRSKQSFRKVVNEAEILPLLKNYNFDVVYGEELSLKDQILLFSEAKVVMGIHGAGLANALFQHQGASLVELRKKEYGPFNVGYWHLADALNLQYYYYNGLPDSELPLVGKAGNLLINKHDFEEELLKKLSDFK